MTPGFRYVRISEIADLMNWFGMMRMIRSIAGRISLIVRRNVILSGNVFSEKK